MIMTSTRTSISVSLLGQQSVRQTAQLTLLARTDRVRRFNRVAPIAAAADLDDDVSPIGIDSNDVGFAPSPPVVALDNLIAARLQVGGGKFLAGCAQRLLAVRMRRHRTQTAADLARPPARTSGDVRDRVPVVPGRRDARESRIPCAARIRSRDTAHPV